MKETLCFKSTDYTLEKITVDGKTYVIRAWRNVSYLPEPSAPQLQTLNVFAREQLFDGEKINGFSIDSCPIFFPCTVSGYRQAKAADLTDGYSIQEALAHGYVVVTAGARGVGSADETGRNIGMAPWGVVDYKAVVRYLRLNRGYIPGDVEKIIVNGTSAGGAISALLGATGNHPDFDPFLGMIGAADEKDNVFAASCYGPVTNLDHEDMAYEWEFCGQRRYYTKKKVLSDNTGGKPEKIRVYHEMNEEQMQLSPLLKAQFPSYINGLGLVDGSAGKLSLNEDGSGSFRDYISDKVLESAQAELDRGNDLSGYKWLTVINGKAADVNFDAFTVYRSRMKATPAFDSIYLDTPENALFSSDRVYARHFSEFSFNYSLKNGVMAESEQIRMMNPMYYISDPDSDVARYFRIRQGTIDHNLSLAITAVLAISLQMNGRVVDYFMPWDIPHSGDYDLNELFRWIDGIVND